MTKIILKYGIKEQWEGLKNLFAWFVPTLFLLVIIWGDKYGNYIGGIKYFSGLLIIMTLLRLGLQRVYFFQDNFLDVGFLFFKTTLLVKNVSSVIIEWDEVKSCNLTLKIISSHERRETISIQNNTKIIKSFAKKLKEKFPDLPYHESFEKLVDSTDDQLASYASTKGVWKVMLPTFIKWFSKKSKNHK